MSLSSTETAREVLGVVPLVMCAVRSEMRRFRKGGVSVPQFRALGVVHRRPGVSLSDVAEHIGLTLPSMSRMIDGLVERKLMTRRHDPADRRRVTLEITARGRGLWQSAYDFTEAALAARMSTLAESERAAVSRAMLILQKLFTRGEAGDCR